MATLYKRKDSSCWWMRFQHAGKRHQESTGETNERKARKKLKERQAELRGHNSADDLFKRLCSALDELPITDGNRIRQEFANTLLSGIGDKVKICDAWDTWLHSPKKGNAGAVTLKDYQGLWKRFSNWANENDIEYLHEASAARAEAYAADLWKSGITGRTYNKALTFLRSFWTALKVQASLSTNPWTDIPIKSKDPQSRRMLESNELLNVCGNAQGWMRPLFALGIYTGMRLHDCACLRWQEVNLTKMVITRKTAKRKKAVIVPINPALAELLLELDQSGEYVIPETATLYETDSSTLSRTIQKHFLNCGIDTHAAGTGSRIVRNDEAEPLRNKNGTVIDPRKTKQTRRG